MAIDVLNTYRADTGAFYALLRDTSTGKTAELKYRSMPTLAQARADAQAVFNPPTNPVIEEDGSTVQVVGPSFDLSLTSAQRTALANALTTVETFSNRVSGKVQQLSQSDLYLVRQLSPLLDRLIAIKERLS